MSNNEIEKITSTYIQNPVTKKIERVACYVRVSTQEQKLHGISIDAQKAKLQAYADEHNMKIVEWYIDEGVSGRKLIKKRPELQRMIQDAEKKNFERILFIKIDRFFRSVAEYHECMKRIAPVVWTTTEEQYDLTTANGRMLVNMKLTIAEMEADQGGERIRIVNDYKVQTGQPLVGTQCLPLGLMVAYDEETKRKKVVKNPDEEEIVTDLIEHYLTYQSRRKTIGYIYAKHHYSLTQEGMKKFLSNTMLYGFYRNNPNYCEAYLTKEEFDNLQKVIEKNIKGQPEATEDRSYLFTQLIICPVCGKPLVSQMRRTQNWQKKKYQYKSYRCSNHFGSIKKCTNQKTISESVMEKNLLADIEKYLKQAKLEQHQIEEGTKTKVKKYNIDDIHDEIDRLNYSWQTGKIRKVEKYEADYAELLEKLAKAEAEQDEKTTVDFAKIEEILQSGWRGIYNALNDENKRAFWRSFVKSIELKPDGKTLQRVNFF